jgi:hypothetical protein
MVTEGKFVKLERDQGLLVGQRVRGMEVDLEDIGCEGALD